MSLQRRNTVTRADAQRIAAARDRRRHPRRPRRRVPHRRAGDRCRPQRRCGGARHVARGNGPVVGAARRRGPGVRRIAVRAVVDHGDRGRSADRRVVDRLAPCEPLHRAGGDRRRGGAGRLPARVEPVLPVVGSSRRGGRRRDRRHRAAAPPGVHPPARVVVARRRRSVRRARRQRSWRRRLPGENHRTGRLHGHARRARTGRVGRYRRGQRHTVAGGRRPRGRR